MFKWLRKKPKATETNPLERLGSLQVPMPLVVTRSKSETRVASTPRREDDDSFTTSMLVGMATDSALLGYAAGGSLSGGIVGASLADTSSSASSSSDYGSSSGCDSSSSSYDSGSSFDSGSSGCDSSGSW